MDSAKEPKPGKKSYHQPQVEDYGNIKDITQSTGSNPPGDSGANNMHS